MKSIKLFQKALVVTALSSLASTPVFAMDEKELDLGHKPQITISQTEEVDFVGRWKNAVEKKAGFKEFLNILEESVAEEKTITSERLRNIRGEIWNVFSTQLKGFDGSDYGVFLPVQPGLLQEYSEACRHETLVKGLSKLSEEGENPFIDPNELSNDILRFKNKMRQEINSIFLEDVKLKQELCGALDVKESEFFASLTYVHRILEDKYTESEYNESQTNIEKEIEKQIKEIEKIPETLVRLNLLSDTEEGTRNSMLYLVKEQVKEEEIIEDKKNEINKVNEKILKKIIKLNQIKFDAVFNNGIRQAVGINVLLQNCSDAKQKEGIQSRLYDVQYSLPGSTYVPSVLKNDEGANEQYNSKLDDLKELLERRLLNTTRFSFHVKLSQIHALKKEIRSFSRGGDDSEDSSEEGCIIF
jgi:hypothetical protein